MTRQEVLNGALALNGDDKKYTLKLDGDSIVMETKWMDALHFAPERLTDEVRGFKFTVKLAEDGTYTEHDASKSSSVSVGRGGLNAGYSSFSGKQISFDKSISFGKNKETDEVGVQAYTFNSEEFKKPMRDYMTACGWKKAQKSFWVTLFGR